MQDRRAPPTSSGIDCTDYGNNTPEPVVDTPHGGDTMKFDPASSPMVQSARCSCFFAERCIFATVVLGPANSGHSARIEKRWALPLPARTQGRTGGTEWDSNRRPLDPQSPAQPNYLHTASLLQKRGPPPNGGEAGGWGPTPAPKKNQASRPDSNRHSASGSGPERSLVGGNR